MTLIFPLHLLYLRCTTPFPVKSYLLGLSKSFKERFTTAFSSSSSGLCHNGILDFPIHRLLAVIIFCTVGITAPALLWFVALNYASLVQSFFHVEASLMYVQSERCHRYLEFKCLLGVCHVSQIETHFMGAKAPRGGGHR